MKPNISAYLGSLGMGENFIQRVIDLHDECKLLTARDIEEVFVSDFIAGGQRTFQDLHFFTETGVYRLKDFINQFQFEMGLLERMSRCIVYKSDFDFRQPETTTVKSVFQVAASWEPIPFSLSLLATAGNCAYLWKVVRKFISPRVIR